MKRRSCFEFWNFGMHGVRELTCRSRTRTYTEPKRNGTKRTFDTEESYTQKWEGCVKGGRCQKNTRNEILRSKMIRTLHVMIIKHSGNNAQIKSNRANNKNNLLVTLSSCENQNNQTRVKPHIIIFGRGYIKFNFYSLALGFVPAKHNKVRSFQFIRLTNDERLLDPDTPCSTWRK